MGRLIELITKDLTICIHIEFNYLILTPDRGYKSTDMDKLSSSPAVLANISAISQRVFMIYSFQRSSLNI